MKKGEKAEFKLSWWKSSQPKAMLSAGKLEMALKLYETALVRMKKDADADALKNVQSAMDGVEAAAKAVVTEAGKAKNNPEMEWTAQSLGKLDYASERKAASALVEEDDEGGLLDGDTYKIALRKSLKRLEAGPMNFGFVAGKKGPEHRLVLHRSQAGRGLAAAAMKELDLHLSTFGVARMMPERDGVIGLTLEGKNIPGLAKKIRLMLRGFKPQPYKDAALFVDGAEVADEHDPADEDEAAEFGEATHQTAAPAAAPVAPGTPDFASLRAELAAMVEQIKVLPGGVGAQQALVPLVAASTEALRAQDFELVQTRLAGLRTAIATAKAAETGGAAGRDAPAGGAGLPEGAFVRMQKSRLAWDGARKKVRGEIRQFRTAVEAEMEGDVDEIAVIDALDQLDDILVNLNEDLIDTLDDMLASDVTADEYQLLLARAKEQIAGYRRYAEGNALIRKLEGATPVGMNLTISSTMSKTLQALEATIR